MDRMTPAKQPVKVLVVEDDPLNLKLLQLMLDKLGVNMIAARDAEEALELLGTDQAEVMLLDIALGPGMSGITLMEELRGKDEFKKTPIIAVTAYNYSELRDYVNDQGFNEYMGKPISFKQLKDMFEKLNLVSPS
ncbi:MAG: response regulator [Candidatus Neomarinimicrobiota bacterium]|nr:MAG: response regulator [Candidatus Neomarinimicrobiota bacterium]